MYDPNEKYIRDLVKSHWSTQEITGIRAYFFSPEGYANSFIGDQNTDTPSKVYFCKVAGVLRNENSNSNDAIVIECRNYERTSTIVRIQNKFNVSLNDTPLSRPFNFGWLLFSGFWYNLADADDIFISIIGYEISLT